MSRLRALPIVVVCSLVIVPAAMAGGILEKLSERPAGAFDREQYLASQQRLHSLLESEQAAAGLDRGLVVRLSRSEIEQLNERPANERKLLVGTAKRIDGAAFNFAGYHGSRGEPRSMPFGALRELADGGYSWTATLRSPGATALRVRFDRFFLPGDHEMYVYSRDGQVYGPYVLRGPTGSKDFWSHTVSGDEMIIQLRYRPGAGPRPEGTPRFVLRELAFIGDRFRIDRSRVQTKAFCSFNEPCVENVNCPGTSGAVDTARDAVAEMLFRSGGGFFICTGGLLADTDSGSDRPLFLTANHCISRGREANSLETFFFYETTCSSPDCTFPSVPSTVGASILASNRTSDYTLMELGDPAPGGAAFLGWTSTPVANSHGTNLFRVSHPAGSPQAYSEHSVDTSKVTCSTWPRGNWIYSADTFGATEGGSSGSPVVNASGQVVGQLSGACGFNVNDPCDADSNATVDGAFAAYFSSIQSILDPGTGGGCTLGQKGDACVVDADCCSNKCKGPSGSKSCK